jgi:hypothetical protein
LSFLFGSVGLTSEINKHFSYNILHNGAIILVFNDIHFIPTFREQLFLLLETELGREQAELFSFNNYQSYCFAQGCFRIKTSKYVKNM